MPELYRHNPDPLLNLGYFVSRCLNCGRVQRDALEVDAPSLWGECECGHVYEVPNRTRWH